MCELVSMKADEKVSNFSYKQIEAKYSIFTLYNDYLIQDRLVEKSGDMLVHMMPTFVNCGFCGRCGVASRLDPRGIMGLRAPIDGLSDIGDGDPDSSIAEGAEN